MPEVSQLTPRQILDPTGTLPTIELQEMPDQSLIHPSAVGYVALHEGVRVGEAEIAKLEDGQHKFDTVSIDEQYLQPGMKRGYGLALYLAAIEKAHDEGNSFRTDPIVMTESAAKVWRKFIDRGIAEQLEPLHLVKAQAPPDQDLYKGYAVIHPPQA